MLTRASQAQGGLPSPQRETRGAETRLTKFPITAWPMERSKELVERHVARAITAQEVFVLIAACHPAGRIQVRN
jgi:hypothetical protein